MSEHEHGSRSAGRGQPSSSNTGGSAGQDLLADRLSDLARSLQDERSLEETLSGIVHAAVGTVPGARHASISGVRRRREVRTLAATDELSRAVDRVQYATGQGPCLDALYEQETVRVSILSEEDRWPEFRRRVAELSVGSMLAVQLFVRGDELGALNLLSQDVDAFGDESEHVALLFASHAAVAMSGAQQQDNLRRALQTRELIGQARGILMERFKITGDQAFGLLVRASQGTNRKLQEVAEDLAATGELGGR